MIEATSATRSPSTGPLNAAAAGALINMPMPAVARPGELPPLIADNEVNQLLATRLTEQLSTRREGGIDFGLVLGIPESDQKNDRFKTVRHFLRNVSLMYEYVSKGAMTLRGKATPEDMQALMVNSLAFADRLYHPESHEAPTTDEMIGLLGQVSKIKGAEFIPDGDIATMPTDPELAINLAELVWNAGKVGSKKIWVTVTNENDQQQIAIKNNQKIDSTFEAEVFAPGFSATSSTGEGLDLLNAYVHEGDNKTTGAESGFISYSTAHDGNVTTYKVEGARPSKTVLIDKKPYAGDDFTEFVLHRNRVKIAEPEPAV